MLAPHREHDIDEEGHFWNVQEEENQNQDSGFFQKLGSGKHKITITNHIKSKRRYNKWQPNNNAELIN